MSMSKSQKMLIIVGIVIFLFIGAAAFALSGRHNKSGTNNQASTSTKTSSSTSTSTNQSHSINDALSLVRATYIRASAYTQSTSTPDQGEIDAVKSYLSDDLYTQLTQTLLTNMATGDQIICRVGGANTGYDVQLVNSVGTHATVALTEKFDDPVTVMYTVDLPSLKITTIQCPQ